MSREREREKEKEKEITRNVKRLLERSQHGRDSVIRTSYVLVGADVVVPEKVGGVQSAISSLPDCDIFPAGHWVQVLSDKESTCEG